MKTNQSLVSVRDLKVHFPITKGIIFQKHIGDVKAVDGISFEVHKGETLSLVGESGCGKSTTGRALLQLIKPTGGTVLFKDQDVSHLHGEALRRKRQEMQMIFQDPYASLNPRMPVSSIIAEPLRVHGFVTRQTQQEKVQELMRTVGLNPAFLNRFPHEFSGGQRQRIGIARSIGLNPDFVVCDEPISALDVSIQAQIINLLQDLQEQFDLTYLFIAHDLSVVRHISDRVAVMYLGKLAELASRDEIYKKPLHPYTEALLSAVPIPNPVIEKRRKRLILKGEVPTPTNPPKGCNFNTRCPYVMDRCREAKPEFRDIGGGHWVACYKYE